MRPGVLRREARRTGVWVVIWTALAGTAVTVNMAVLPRTGYLPSRAIDLGRSAAAPSGTQLSQAGHGTWLGLTVTVAGKSSRLQRAWDWDRQEIQRGLLTIGAPGGPFLFRPVRFHDNDPGRAQAAAPGDAAEMGQAKRDADSAALATLKILSDISPVPSPAGPGPVFRTGNINGGSAGTAMALADLDNRTSGDLTGGRTVAVTGAVTQDGVVLKIGGVGAKAELAAANGAALMIVPLGNADEAAAAIAALPGNPDVEVRGVGSVLEAAAVLCQERWHSDDALCDTIRRYID